MQEHNPKFNDFVARQFAAYQTNRGCTIEMMAGKLLEDSRSYVEHKNGTMGFSGHTICRFLVHLSESEALDFVHGLKTEVWTEEFEDEMKTRK